MVFLVGIVGILTTVSLHAVTITALIVWLSRHGQRMLSPYGMARRSFLIAWVASLLAVKHAADVGIWAACLWWLAGDQLHSFSDAYYFSSVTYTTLGYGDIVLDGRWRMICGFEAMNGVILFGLSTAFLFSILQHLWGPESSEKQSEGKER